MQTTRTVNNVEVTCEMKAFAKGRKAWSVSAGDKYMVFTFSSELSIDEAISAYCDITKIA